MLTNEQFAQQNQNVAVAIQNINPAITYCEQNRLITNPEAQQIRAALNQPVQLDSFKRSIESTFGFNPVAPNTIWDFCVRKVTAAANTLRGSQVPNAGYNPGYNGYNNYSGVNTVNMQQYAVPNNYVPQTNGYYAQPMGQNPYVNYGAVQQPQYNPYVNRAPYYQTPQQQQAASLQNDFANIYGVAPNNNQAFNGAPTPNANQAPIARSENKPFQGSMHTNKPYEIEGLEDNLRPNIVTIRPATTEENPFYQNGELKETVDDGSTRWNRPAMSILEILNKFCSAGEAVVEEPHETTEELVNDVMEETPEAFHGDYAHVVTSTEPEVIEVDYEAGKNSFLKCVTALKSKKGTDGILALFNQIENLNTNFRVGIVKIVTKAFNDALALNFVRVTPDGITRAPECETLPEVARMLVDGPEDFMADWRASKSDYQKAIRLVLRDSIFRIFSGGAKKFLNPKDKDDKSFILGSTKIPLKVNGKKLKPSMLIAPDQKTLDDINRATQNVFVILVDKRTLITNLEFSTTEPSDMSLSLLNTDVQPESAAVLELVKKYGNLEIVNPNHPEYLEHPVRAGEIYDNQVLLRRK